jgi:phospholipid/cholesterol/gamma-HCH transport system substrate-binding protein
VIRTIPRGWAALAAGFALAGAVLFGLMSARFGGPSLHLGAQRVLHVTVRDTLGLSVRSDVVVRGVRAGRVDGVHLHGDTAVLDLVLEGEPVIVHRGATVRVGTKTLLGEAYVDLNAGPAAAPALPAVAQLPLSAARDNVEVDEALRALGPAARRDVRATVAEAGRGAGSPHTSARVGATIAALRGTVGQLHTLGAELRGEDVDLAAAVTASRQVVGELAARDGAVRDLVRNGRATLSATAGRDAALRAAAFELPRLLGAARAALSDARPLLREARPLTADLRAAAPGVAAAARQLPPVAGDLLAVLRRARALRRAAAPVLAAAEPLLRVARPAARRLQPTLGNVVTMARYLAPRSNTIAAWFANTADLGLKGDAKGSWARFFIFADPQSAGGAPAPLRANSYTRPGDAADNQPYRPGDYPRLRPTPVP